MEKIMVTGSMYGLCSIFWQDTMVPDIEQDYTLLLLVVTL